MPRRDLKLDREIGGRIRAAREEKHIKQAALGRLLGRTSPTSMWKYEQGKAGLSTASLLKLANFLDLSLDWLITGQERVGQDPVLVDAERERLLLQFNATPEERGTLDEHLRGYAHHRITSGYIVAFLLGFRAQGNVKPATDTAILATTPARMRTRTKKKTQRKR